MVTAEGSTVYKVFKIWKLNKMHLLIIGDDDAINNGGENVDEVMDNS